jgi:DNA-binding PadR family transcriptional regulator
VLTAVVGPASHGYAIAARVRAQADDADDGELEVAEGTVYPVLHRLERSGLVRSGWTEMAGRRRRVYELTGAGAAAVERATVAPVVAGPRPFRLGHLVRRPA